MMWVSRSCLDMANLLSDLLASLPLEVEMRSGALARYASQFPVLRAERVEVRLGGQALGCNLPNHLLVFPAWFHRGAGWRHVAAAWFGRAGRKGHLESCGHSCSIAGEKGMSEHPFRYHQ